MMGELLKESGGLEETICPCCFAKLHFDSDHLGAVIACPRCARVIELVSGVSEAIPQPDFKSDQLKRAVDGCKV